MTIRSMPPAGISRKVRFAFLVVAEKRYMAVSKRTMETAAG